MNTAADYFSQSQLALAAYADLSGPVSTYPAALRAAGMSALQANQFVSSWEVITQYNVSSSGLSATVFQQKINGTPTGQKYLTIRGTDDGVDIATDLIDIGILGTYKYQSQYTALKAKVTEWLGNGTLSPSFTVTGHSLGGFLATGIAADFAGNVTHAYLYNAPGMGGLIGTLLSPFSLLRSALGIGASTIDPAKISNLKSDAGISPIAGLGVQVAPVISIATEDQTASDISNPPAARNHSLQPLTDSLALYSTFAKLAPNLTTTQIGQILKASSYQNNLSLENTLDALCSDLLGPGIPATPEGITQRDAGFGNGGDDWLFADVQKPLADVLAKTIAAPDTQADLLDRLDAINDFAWRAAA